jgi:hypothetical protein
VRQKNLLRGEGAGIATYHQVREHIDRIPGPDAPGNMDFAGETSSLQTGFSARYSESLAIR